MTRQKQIAEAFAAFGAVETAADAVYAEQYAAAWERFGCSDRERTPEAFRAHVRPFWSERCAKVHAARAERQAAVMAAEAVAS